MSVEVDSRDGKAPLSESISLALGDLPLITPEINYLTDQEIQIDNVLVDNKELSVCTNVNLIIKSKCMLDKAFLDVAKSTFSGKGFVVSRESVNCEIPKDLPNGFQLVAVLTIEEEKLFLIQLSQEEYKVPETVIRVTSSFGDWLEPLKAAMKTGSVLIYSQNESLSGILGLINCIRKEPNGVKSKCVFIDDPKAPPFDINNPFYESQLKLGLATNVLKNGQWGSYRHLLIQQSTEKKPRRGHFYANSLVKGDLSTLVWLNGPISDDHLNQDIVRIQYASLNFRDVMLATGKVCTLFYIFFNFFLTFYVFHN